MKFRANESKRMTLLCCAMLLAAQVPSLACGPFFDTPTFSYVNHPDMPLSLYASGKLGVLRPDFARSYLVVAWRYLNNTPLTPLEQKSILALWEQRLNIESTAVDNDLKTWAATLKKYDKTGKYDDIYPQRDFSGAGDIWFVYLNCPGSAFIFATQTANKVAEIFGPTSKELKDWLKAQNTVFCNCSGNVGDGKAKIPSVAAADFDAKFKPYRDYQIAAANFYANNYDKAKEEFEKIAQDKSSPFHELANYLTVRTMVRKATVAAKNDDSLLAQSEKKLESMLADKSMEQFKVQVQDLLGFVKFKLGGAARLTELAKALSNNQEGSEAGNNLCDYTFLFDKLIGVGSDDFNDVADTGKKLWNSAPSNLKADDMSAWILAMQSLGDEVRQFSLKKWHDTKKVQWLIAALAQTQPNSPDLGTVLTEADKIPSSSPAYLELQYLSADLNYKQRKTDEMRNRIDKILSDKSLMIPPTTRNMFMSLRSRVAKNFGEFLQFALERPVAIESGWQGAEIPTDFAKVEASANFAVLKPAFNNESTAFFNTSVPVNLLAGIPDISGIASNADLKADSLQSLWVRYFLLKDFAAVSRITPKLKAAAPALKPLLSTYEASKNIDEQVNSGTFMILRNPGMRPYLSQAYGRATPMGKIDDYQDNWWSSSNLTPTTDAKQLKANTELAACLSATEKAQALAESKKLAAVAESAVYLGQNTIAWAKKNPQDPRIPEALHLAVRATRFCDRTSNSSKVSKEAFTILHNKYPHNPWTAKTKYFY